MRIVGYIERLSCPVSISGFSSYARGNGAAIAYAETPKTSKSMGLLMTMGRRGAGTMKVFYFTATGNGLAIAKAIGGEAISIPQALKAGTTRYKDDVIGIITPTYAGNPARIVVEFLKRVDLDADYRFAVASYGGVMGNPIKPLASAAAAKGWSFDYTASVKMVDNFLPLFDVAAEREKKDQAAIGEALASIAADVAARKRSAAHVGVGNALYGAVGGLAYNKVAGPKVARESFSVSDACISCGVCARFCPAGNITVEEGQHPAFGDACLGCYGCAHICPHNAIHAKGEKSAARWRNPDVTAKELLDANAQ